MATTKYRFTKMHGAGNDYIYVDTMANPPVEQPEELARRWSAPHTGIGSDGLVLIGRSPVAEADFTMRIFNADGSEAMMCGNAARCVGRYLHDKGYADGHDAIRLSTASGIKHIRLLTDRLVSVDMLAPRTSDEQHFRPSEAASLPEGRFISMGNPHYVVFTDDVNRITTDGPRLERHAAFPCGCNIEYARVLSDGRIRMRVWERGSGLTMACGTGACATAVAATLSGLRPRRSTVVADGGELMTDWRESDGHVILTGPAVTVFEGEICV